MVCPVSNSHLFLACKHALTTEPPSQDPWKCAVIHLSESLSYHLMNLQALLLKTQWTLISVANWQTGISKNPVSWRSPTWGTTKKEILDVSETPVNARLILRTIRLRITLNSTLTYPLRWMENGNPLSLTNCPCNSLCSIPSTRWLYRKMEKAPLTAKRLKPILTSSELPRD